MISAAGRPSSHVAGTSAENNCARVIGTGNSEAALLPHRIEQTRRNKVLHFGEQSLKLLEDLPASQCELEAMW